MDSRLDDPRDDSLRATAPHARASAAGLHEAGARPARLTAAAALACFFLSGAAGLVYEICWIRRASLVFGSTQEALSTVLAVFFLGLAIGSWVFGRVALSTPRPLRLYAVLEVALAGLAIASVPLFGWADKAYGRIYGAFPDAHAFLTIARIGLVSLILLLPTVLMGGTLPLFVRQFVTGRGGLLRSVGLLYGINTLGAALGCALAGAVLLPALGMRASVALAAGANIAAAAVALALRNAPPARESDAGAAGAAAAERRGRGSRGRSVGTARGAAATVGRQIGPAPQDRSKVATGVLAVLVFLTGFTALAYEVLWTRFATLVVYNTVYTYTITLTIVLVGIVAGSWLGARFFHRSNHGVEIFGLLQVLSALSVIGTLSAPPGFWRALGDPLVAYVVLMLPAAVFSGASFPLAVQLAVEDPGLAAAGVGRIAMLNTLGGIAGALAAGFVGLPLLGLQRSTTLVTATSIAIGFAAWTLLRRPRLTWARGAAIGVGLVAWLAIPRLADTRVPADFLEERKALVDFREGRMSNVTVARRDGIQSLAIDRLWQGQDLKTHQIVTAHLPMLLHPRPRRVLVVGVGSGQTASRFLDYDPERLDCVDIEPAVFEMVRAHFDARWMSDPRVHLITEDGHNYLLHAPATYDLISLEVGQLFRPGAASFYTVDFYRRMRERLAPGGIVSQFVPIAFLPPETFRGVLASFLAVFPQSTLWYNTAELLLVGVRGDRFVLDPRRCERLLADPRIHGDLSYRHWGGADRALNRPNMLLGCFLCGPRGLAALAAGAPLYREDRPILDYQTSGQPFGAGHEIECLALLRPRVESLAAIAPGALPPESLSAVRAAQSRNLDQILSNRLLDPVWGAPRKSAERAAIEGALAANPENSKAIGLMGDALTEENRLEEALSCYRRAVELRPEDGPALLDLANALARVGQDAEAIVRFRAAIERGVGGADAHVALGESLQRSGDSVAAIRAYREALRVDPGQELARRRLADLGATRPAAPR